MGMYQLTPLTHEQKKQLILERCEFLGRIGLWPNEMKPREWFENFQGEEEEAAACDLLKTFMYFPKSMTRELLRSAIRKIMPHVIDFTGNAAEAKTCWASITRRMLIIPVRDPSNSSADSGYQYARLARDTFDLLPGQLPDFPQVLPQLVNLDESGLPNIVVFVDDFVGSGEQFINMWKREYEPEPGSVFSCKSVARSSISKFFYCPLVATSYGIESIIATIGNSVTICPAHILPPECSALHPRSRVWSNDIMRRKGPAALKKISERVPMPDNRGLNDTDWKGYRELGLNIVLNDAIPDACLGVFRFNEHQWHPLYNKAG
jgi:hypothetical protein